MNGAIVRPRRNKIRTLRAVYHRTAAPSARQTLLGGNHLATDFNFGVKIIGFTVLPPIAVKSQHPLGGIRRDLRRLLLPFLTLHQRAA